MQFIFSSRDEGNYVNDVPLIYGYRFANAAHYILQPIYRAPRDEGLLKSLS